MNARAKGNRLERKAKQELEEQGYLVIKSGASLSPFDLIALGYNHVRCIQIKANRPQFKAVSKSFNSHLTTGTVISELWVKNDYKPWKKFIYNKGVFEEISEIILTDDTRVYIDKNREKELNKFRWGSLGEYARTGYPQILLHHLIIGKPKPGFEVDHINGWKRDNRLSNLRFATRSENRANTIKPHASNLSKKPSRFKGVTWDKRVNSWFAYCKKDGKVYHYGYYKSETEAAEAYNRGARTLFGEFARLNIIQQKKVSS